MSSANSSPGGGGAAENSPAQALPSSSAAPSTPALGSATNGGGAKDHPADSEMTTPNTPIKPCLNSILPVTTPGDTTPSASHKAVPSSTPPSLSPSPTITFITIVVNKGKVGQNPGPFLDRKKVDKLPDTFGPGPINRVVRESVQRLVDASYDQKEVRLLDSEEEKNEERTSFLDIFYSTTI